MSEPAPSKRRSSKVRRREPITEMTPRTRSRRSILKSLRVVRVAPRTIRQTIEDLHYIHSMPSVTRVCFAVYLDDRLVGAAVFTQGARNSHHLLQGASPRHVLTLARFWMADGLPANNESRVLGIMLRDLARDGHYKLVVSFADPVAGHTGIVYRASSWLFWGTTEPERALVIDGTVTHPRTASERYGSNSVAHLRRTGLTVVVKRTLPKFRYLYLLDRSWTWRLRGRPQPYPKRGGRSPPARGVPMRNGPRGAVTPHEPVKR